MGKVCIKCQRCCKVAYIPVHPGVEVELYKVRGFKVKYHQGIAFIIINQKCQHLTKDGCNIYDSRPMACVVYDGRNDLFDSKMCRLGEENG